MRIYQLKKKEKLCLQLVDKNEEASIIFLDKNAQKKLYGCNISNVRICLVYNAEFFDFAILFFNNLRIQSYLLLIH